MDREHEIKERAYAIWEAEGRPHDRADDHWRQAEDEVSAQADAPAAVAGEELAPAETLQVDAPVAPSVPARKRKAAAKAEPAAKSSAADKGQSAAAPAPTTRSEPPVQSKPAVKPEASAPGASAKPPATRKRKTQAL